MTPARKKGSSGSAQGGQGGRGGSGGRARSGRGKRPSRRSAGAGASGIAAERDLDDIETAEDAEGAEDFDDESLEGRERAQDIDDGSVAGTRPRRGARRTVMDVVMQLPHYLRLLFGLVTDRRVEALDKLLLVGAIAYIVSPLDLVPDFLPFFGQVDDAFLLIASIERLISNAGHRVVMAHWHGDPDDLSRKNLRLALVAASFFLPRRIRRRLRGMVV